MASTRFQGSLKTHSKCNKEPWDAIIDPDQRAEAGDTPHKTSSTRPWLKLCKERTESFSHLLTGDDSSNQALLPSTQHKTNNMCLTIIKHQWIWMSKPNSLRPQRKKANSLLPIMSWWTLKKAPHSSKIQLMLPQHLSTLMKIFKWD